jgi:hypothetical protein
MKLSLLYYPYNLIRPLQKFDGIRIASFGDNNNWFINLRNLRLPHEMFTQCNAFSFLLLQGLLFFYFIGVICG